MRFSTRRTAAVGMLAGLVAIPASVPALAQDGQAAKIEHRQRVVTELSATGEPGTSDIFTQLMVSGEGPVEVVLENQSTRGLRNLDGLRRPGTDGDSVVYGVDATPAGVSRRTVANHTADLPIEVEVDYQLNGQSVEDPADIVGQTGELEVIYTVRNTTVQSTELELLGARGESDTRTADVAVPFVGALTLPLDDRFVDVRARGAAVAGDGEGNTVVDWKLVLFEPLGAHEETVSFSAQVTDAIVPDANLEIVPVSSDSYGEILDIQSVAADTFVSLQQLADPAQRVNFTLIGLVDGMTGLLDGMNQLADGSEQLRDGLQQAATGAGDLADGTGDAHDGSQRLASGLGDLHDGTIAVRDGTVAVRDGAGALASGLGDLHGGLRSASGGVDDVWAGIQGLGGSVEDSLGPALADALSDALGDNMTPALAGALMDALGDNMTPALAEALEDAIAENMGEPLGDALEDALNDNMVEPLADALEEALQEDADPSEDNLVLILTGYLQAFGVPPVSAFPSAAAWPSERQDALASHIEATTPLDAGTAGAAAAGFQDVYAEQLAAGFADGFTEGFAEVFPHQFGPSFAAGFAPVFAPTFAAEFVDGFSAAFVPAFAAGFVDGFASVFAPGFGDGFGTGFASEFGAGVVAGFRPGLTQLIDGMGQLTSGAGDAAAGSRDLASGAGDLASGAGDLSAGAGDAAQGGRDLRDGLRQIDEGANALASGLGDAHDGSGDLAQGMGDARDGGDQIFDALDGIQETGSQVVLDSIGRAGLIPDELIKHARAADERGQAGEGLPYGTAEGADASAVYQFELAGIGDDEGASTPVRAGAAVLAFGAASALGLGVRRRLV